MGYVLLLQRGCKVLIWHPGHLRPECNLAVNLVRRFTDLTVCEFLPSVHYAHVLTYGQSLALLADADFQTKALNEVKRIAGEGEKEIISRIRVIAAGHSLEVFTPPPPGVSMEDFNPKEGRFPSMKCTQAVSTMVDSIMRGEPFQDDNGCTWDAVDHKPSFVIADMFMGDAAVWLKEKYNIPIYMFYACGNAFSFTRYYAPLAYGGQADGYVEECESVADDEERAKGRSFTQIAKQVFAHSGRYPEDIVRIKGMKPFYEWEDHTQDRWSVGMYWTLAGIHPLVQKADGLILPAVIDLDPEGVEGVKEWFSTEIGRPIFCLGPQLPSSYLDARIRSGSEVSTISGSEVQISYLQPEDNANETIDPSIAFLDAALATYGANSALYITFGSFLTPTLPHLQYLFDVLLQLEVPIPFLFAAASPALKFPEDLKQKIEKSGRGLVVPWAPQQSVLLHPATGWALSHCGYGGLSEALSQGVPIIAWPIAWDQPHNARWLTEVIGTSFELLQVRNGLGPKKAYRGGPDGTEIVGTEEAIKSEMREVFRLCRAEDGRRKREKASEVKQTIRDARTPGGQIDQHYELLGKAIV
ncbi:glycosyltransferase family 1 protein [Calocera viscosa TUFC12733]|uniref:Glycosyltransferase family 1 protein n=1 Tax=Calocera viscosa (strain TUFC12733) TaxID=1330018 RepID=A0A167GNK2_CALVF|nr:glycosyltransferase family 1 protein [Calocera viscosa TUFC12733]